MHIAFVIPDLAGGGAERGALGLAGGLIGRGHRVDVVLFRARIHYSEEVTDDARLFVMDSEPDRRTEEGAALLLSRLVPLHAPSRVWDWITIASALHWDPRCHGRSPSGEEARGPRQAPVRRDRRNAMVVDVARLRAAGGFPACRTSSSTIGP